MINEDATFEQFGYKSTELTPQSNKKIVALCDNCGKVRILKKQGYHDLCFLCANGTEEKRKKTSELHKGKTLSKEHRSRITERTKGEKNPNYGKHHSNEARKKISEAIRGRTHSEETKKKMSEARKGRTHSEETKKKMSEARKGEKHPNYGKKLSEEHKKKIGETQKGKKVSKETRKKLSKAGRGRTHSEETKKKISELKKGKNGRKGEKHPNWHGGISFEPYCPKFNEAFKESIREKFNRTCFLCPTAEAENGRKLSVHHVNYNKDCLCDDSDCEFVPLCSRCHTKTNYNRTYWENLIIDKLAANPEVPAST